MIHDILTVMWKERQGLMRQRGSRARGLLTTLLPMIMLGVLLPLQEGHRWLNNAWSMLLAFIIPLLLVGITIPESFAGERERHTLATLLASRLSDRAILFGKAGLAVVYGWSMALGLLLISVIVVNALEWQGRVLFFALPLAVANTVVSLLMSGLTASLGVLISLRSETAQGAQQALVFTLLIPLMLLQILPVLLMSVVPNGRTIINQITRADFTGVVTVIVIVLLILNAGLFAAALTRFKRSRLILE